MNKLERKKMDELNIFAEKYLGFTMDDTVFLNKLVLKLETCFKEKMGNLTKPEEIFKLNYTEEDYSLLCYFERECVNFKESFLLDNILIDKFGFIIMAPSTELFGKNILELENLSEIKHGLLNNVLASKIFQAILERIKNENKDAGETFLIVNEGIISYEKKLLEKIKLINFKKEQQIRQKSLR